VQLAVRGRHGKLQAWVLDTAVDPASAAGVELFFLLHFVLCSAGSVLQLVGFAFRGDALRLVALLRELAAAHPSTLGDEGIAAKKNSCDDKQVVRQGPERFSLNLSSVIDLQRCYQTYAGGRALVGLKAVAEAALGVTLDKSLQRSEWSQRPLSQAQIAYAAADAAVLVELFDVICSAALLCPYSRRSDEGSRIGHFEGSGPTTH